MRRQVNQFVVLIQLGGRSMRNRADHINYALRQVMQSVATGKSGGNIEDVAGKFVGTFNTSSPTTPKRPPRATLEMQASLKANRGFWLHCQRDCIECGGLGWGIFDGEDVMRDFVCLPRTAVTLRSDDDAQIAANMFAEHALEFIRALAADRIPSNMVQATAQMFLKREPNEEPHSMAIDGDEHGQHFVSCIDCGASWSAIDCEDIKGNEGFSLEEVAAGDDSCRED